MLAFLQNSITLWLFAVRAAPECDVCIPEPYRYPSLQFLAVLIRPYSGQRADKRGLSMIDMPDHADVNTGLFQSFVSSIDYVAYISMPIISNLWVDMVVTAVEQSAG